MIQRKSKPLCLLVGGTSRKHEALSEMLESDVNFSIETSESCIKNARSNGATFAVVFWNRETDSIAHNLKKEVPNLHVLVENNPVAMSGRVERNGFASMFNAQQDLNEVAANIRTLCRPDLRVTKELSQRLPGLATTFLAHLPAIQSSLEEAEKLGAHLLNSLLQATQANKGLVIYKDEEQGEIRVLSRMRIGDSTLNPFNPNSDLAQAIEDIGTIVYADDADVPSIVFNHLEICGCNMMIPLIAQDGIEGWVILKIQQGGVELDYATLQSIAYFAADSFRIGRLMRENAIREAQLQAGLAHDNTAIMIINHGGTIQLLSDSNRLLKFRPGNAKSYHTLSCGTMRRAIAGCLNGKFKERSWTMGQEQRNRVSVSRLPSKATLVVVRPAINDQTVHISGEVWSEIAVRPNKKMNLSADEAPSLRMLFSEPKDSRWTLEVSTEVADDNLSYGQFEGLKCFLQNLRELPLKGVQITASRRRKENVRIEIVCETGLQEFLKADLGPSLVTLINTGAVITKQSCSLGFRWVFDLPIKSQSLKQVAPFRDLNSTSDRKQGLESISSALEKGEKLVA